MKKYEVRQITLKEKLFGVKSRNINEVQSLIDSYANNGWELHTYSQSECSSKGIMAGGDRILATLIFVKED